MKTTQKSKVHCISPCAGLNGRISKEFIMHPKKKIMKIVEVNAVKNQYIELTGDKL